MKKIISAKSNELVPLYPACNEGIKSGCKKFNSMFVNVPITDTTGRKDGVPLLVSLSFSPTP